MLDKKSKTFLIYVMVLEALEMTIYLTQTA